jgi:hemerythrin superfamily protein
MVMGETRSSNVIEMIETQHEQVKKLLTEVTTARGDALEASFCELRRMLAVHETAEEEIVYPALRASGDAGRAMADARTGEEAEATKMLARLEEMTPRSPDFPQAFEELRTAVLRHATAEEDEVLPELRRTQKPQGLAKMAKAFELAEKAAPTHPHPHAGTSAASHLIAGPALAIMDHVRDALHKG